jgi:6-pyruvoyltetrahydropterin/6-carboxytetrahydropterin synthase
MYEVGVSRTFNASHHLTGGDWGEENMPHTHPYKVEVRLSGAALDRFGYLVDICLLDQIMDDLVSYFADKDLNRLPEFAGLNPSIEHFSRIWCHKLLDRLDRASLTTVSVRIWESSIAWAKHTKTL